VSGHGVSQTAARTRRAAKISARRNIACDPDAIVPDTAFMLPFLEMAAKKTNQKQ
jgi:hypothetical protein